MTNYDEQKEEKDKILEGLKMVYKKLIEYKKEKKSVLVVLNEDNKIVKIESDHLE